MIFLSKPQTQTQQEIITTTTKTRLIYNDVTAIKVILFILVVLIGQSGVRALPLAAGINVSGHYKWHFFLLLSLSSSGLIANSPRRGCRRVLQFSMGS